MKHDVFISYRRKDIHLVGRIYDRLLAEGFQPFFDVTSMSHGTFTKEIQQKIKECPNFLLVISKHFMRKKKTDESDIYFQEIEQALQQQAAPYHTNIIVVSAESFPGHEFFRGKLPQSIKAIVNENYTTLSPASFQLDMNRVVATCLRRQSDRLEADMPWVRTYKSKANLYMTSRRIIEPELLSWENRVGKDLVEKTNRNEPIESHQIKEIRMSCYAASLMLAPTQSSIDRLSFDQGFTGKLFEKLLSDPGFSLEFILTKPYSAGAQDAVTHHKLGNSALREDPNQVFTLALKGLTTLIKTSPTYQKAYQEKRLRIYFTEMALPYATFQITYKEELRELNHIKIDLYSPFLDSSTQRRSIVLFQHDFATDESLNYSFFNDQYQHLLDSCVSYEKLDCSQ